MSTQQTLIVNIVKQNTLLAQQLSDQAKDNPEQFRTHATKALAAFTPKDRDIAQAITTPDISAHDVLCAWESTLLPARKKLSQKQTAQRLQKALSSSLSLDDPAAKALADSLINERNQQLLQLCLDELYPINPQLKKDILAEHRAHAAELLEHTDVYLQDFKQRFVNFVIYQHTARLYNRAVYDPFASWLERKRTTLKVSKERRKTTKEEKLRLAHIQVRLDELAAMQDGLVGAVMQKDWDAVHIVSLKNAYEKRISSAPQPVTPAQRLAIFDEVTHEFRDQQTEKLTTGSSQSGLESIRGISADITKLLTRLFDLDNTQKNQLVLQLKEYRALMHEREMIAVRHIQEKQER